MNDKWKSIDEILKFAQELEGHTVAEMNSPYALSHCADTVADRAFGSMSTSFQKETKSKGKFGQYVESEYFGIRTNSSPEPDFYPVPLELKTTGLKNGRRAGLVPKERMPLSMIDYMTIVDEEFHTSHFLSKNAAVLIIWYIYEKGQRIEDRHISLVDIWECIKEDGDQIRKDYEYIRNKIIAGKAHELSEGDTLYLGACTKGDKSSHMRKQPNSDIMARRRAFCFKQPYLKYIYQKMENRKQHRKDHGKIRNFCLPDQTLEDAIRERFSQWIGHGTAELCSIFNVKNHTKSTCSTLAKEILGAEHGKLERQYKEFVAADLQIKIMRINKNGRSYESMSFPAMDYCEIAEQEWEDSELYALLTRKFICPVFQETEGSNDEYRLVGVKLWNMPESDLEVVEEVWDDTKQKIIAGDYDHFIGMGARMIAHVRPHDRKALFNTPTPQGDLQKKKGFWLNGSYINDAILNAPNL